MKTHFLFYLAVFMLPFLTACNNDDIEDVSNNLSLPQSNILINQSGSIDAGEYVFRDARVNPNVVVLNKNNVIIKNDLREVKNEKLKIEVKDVSIAKRIVSGNILYFTTPEDSIFLLRIKDVKQISQNSYNLTTEEGDIDDLFIGGSLELKIDVKRLKKFNNKD